VSIANAIQMLGSSSSSMGIAPVKLTISS
jgi:hypothetical protein